MEVHHHPDVHHKKKKFKEYFLEFLMIFLAVTMGFIAENLREKIADHTKEKEYIGSLLHDLKKDSALAVTAIMGISAQMYGLDTLEMILSPGINTNDSNVLTCYRQQSSLANQHVLDFSNKTITQLVSSGNMRLIRDQSVSDSITQYYADVNDVDEQKNYYVDYFHKCLEIYQQLYAFDSYHTTINSLGKMIPAAGPHKKLQIAVTDPATLTRFKATIEFTKQIVSSYRTDLEIMKKNAASLSYFLREKYHLD